MNEVLTVLMVLFLGTMSFVFSGMEAGLFSLSRVRIRQLTRTGNKRATALHDYLERPERFLWTILVGNTVANFLLIALMVTHLYEIWPVRSYAFWGLLLLLLFTFYVLLDLLPKVLFRRFPNRMCLATVLPFRWLATFLTPAVAPLARLAAWLAPGQVRLGQFFGNREEFRVLVQEGKHALSNDERALIDRVLSLQKLTVQRIMVGWESVTTVGVNAPAKYARELCSERKLSRIPVEDEDGRKVAGVLSLKTLIFSPHAGEDARVEDFMTPALLLSPDVRLEVALKKFQQTGHRMAVVVDDRKYPVGIVSLRDVLKVIFGEVTL